MDALYLTEQKEPQNQLFMKKVTFLMSAVFVLIVMQSCNEPKESTSTGDDQEIITDNADKPMVKPENAIWHSSTTYDIDLNTDEYGTVFYDISNFNQESSVDYDTFIEYIYELAMKGGHTMYLPTVLGEVNLENKVTPEKLKATLTSIDTVYVEDSETGELVQVVTETNVKPADLGSISWELDFSYSTENGIEMRAPRMSMCRKMYDEMTGEFRGIRSVFFMDMGRPQMDRNKKWLNFMCCNTGSDSRSRFEVTEYIYAPDSDEEVVPTENLATLIGADIQAGKLTVYADEAGKEKMDPAEFMTMADFETIHVQHDWAFDQTSNQLQSTISKVGFYEKTASEATGEVEMRPLGWVTF